MKNQDCEKYQKLVNEILRKEANGGNINESRIPYDESHSERLSSDLEQALRDRRHSLGVHPAFPDDDEYHFEEKIIAKRFKNVVKNAKKQFNTNEISNEEMLAGQLPIIRNIFTIEKDNREQLQELAIRMVREDFDIPEDAIEITAELVDKISLEGTKRNPRPIQVDVEFDSHDEIKNANEEVVKRRLVNAMIQGAAKKNHHMFHMVDDELSDIDVRLPNEYGKLMAAADYSYFVVDEMDRGIPGGVVKVEFPKDDNDIPKIHAQALVFPVLIHELAKGVMEILSSHGLPSDEKIQKYVLGKADFLAAEPWDMRLGTALWEKFTEMIDPNDFEIKHHIYMELVSKPTEEFNETMKEIFAGTTRGKQIITDIVDEIRGDMRKDEFNEALNQKRTEVKTKKYLNKEDIDNIDLSDYYFNSRSTPPN